MPRDQLYVPLLVEEGPLFDAWEPGDEDWLDASESLVLEDVVAGKKLDGVDLGLELLGVELGVDC